MQGALGGSDSGCFVVLETERCGEEEGSGGGGEVLDN